MNHRYITYYESHLLHIKTTVSYQLAIENSHRLVIIDHFQYHGSFLHAEQLMLIKLLSHVCGLKWLLYHLDMLQIQTHIAESLAARSKTPNKTKKLMKYY